MRNYLVVLCVLVCSACTISPNPEAGMDADFHVPFQKKNWATSEYEDTAHNRNFCVVSTGYNGVKVILRQDAGTNKLAQAVKSTRSMSPGATFRVAIGSHVYRTSDEFFPQAITPALIADMKSGGTAYLEWREADAGKNGGGRQRHSSMVPLDGFSQQHEECVMALK